MSKKNFEVSAEFSKTDSELGLVFGWGIICTKNGDPYFDRQDDHIPEESMLEAVTEFMKASRAAKDMHTGDQVGSILYAFPLTDDIAKAFEIECPYTGLLLAMQPESEEILAKYANGEYTGFSIGGVRIKDEEVDF